MSILVSDPGNGGPFATLVMATLPPLPASLADLSDQLLEGVGSPDSMSWWYLGSDGLGINCVFYTIECLSLPGQGYGRGR